MRSENANILNLCK